MLIHHNPAAFHLITFLCPLTLACATVDCDEDTIHPATLPDFALSTPAFLSEVSAAFSALRGESANPTLSNSIAVLPEWMLFSSKSEKLFIAHTTSPVFLSPLRENFNAIHPIADSPPMESNELEKWLPIATAQAIRLVTNQAEEEVTEGMRE